MKLRTYLADKNILLKDFSKKIGAHPNYISRIMYGYVKPGKRLERDIIRETNGVVSFDDNEKCCGTCGRVFTSECVEPQQIAV